MGFCVHKEMLFYGKLTFMKRKHWVVKQNYHESSVLSLSLIIFLLPFISLTQAIRFSSFCMEWHETYYICYVNQIYQMMLVSLEQRRKRFSLIWYSISFSRDKTKKKGYIQYTLWFADLILFECMCVAIILAHLIWLDLQVSGEVGRGRG